MRSRSTAKCAASTVTAVGMVIGLALPAMPAMATESAEDPAAAPATSATEAAEARTPAAKGGPATASKRSVVDVAIDVRTDGNGPFTPEDEPGGDASSSNGIVRTMDAITYRVSVNSNDGSSTNERFTVTAPAGTSWAGVPAPCTGPGSATNGADLTCNIGTLAEGRTISVPVVLNVSGDLKNGDTISVPVSATADDAENGPVTATADTVTVSAAARYNLSKDVHASTMWTDVTGPDGHTKGIQLIYPIAVDWQPVVSGQGLLGFERSAGPMTFTDDVSKILGDVPSNVVPWNGGNPVCGPNAFTDWRLDGLPGGAGGGANAVTDSGTFTCEQSAPGEDIDISITGTVTDPTRLPTKNLSGGPVTGGNKPYFVSGYISLWMPNPPAGTSVSSVNTYTALQTTSVSGAQNFSGSTEPTGDNSARRSIVEYAAGSATKRLVRVLDDKSVVEGSARHGDPWTTSGVLLRSDVGAANTGLTPFDNAVLCDTFDRDTQRLTRVGGAAVWTSNVTDPKVQYAAYDMTSPAAGQQATCAEGDGPWLDQPEDVPGGIEAVGAVRATGRIAGGVTGALYSYVTTKDAAAGTRAYDFGHVWFGDRAQEWVHDKWSDAELGAGPLSDSVLITENLARIQKKIVDPGHDAGDTPDETSFAVAGDTVEYALYPSLTNGHTTGTETTVTVHDVLPHNTSYVPGSASVTPSIDTTRDADGNEVQRLTWTLHVTPNEEIDPITYSAAISKLAAPSTITNVTDIASPTDQSPADLRDAARAVRIVNTGGVGVEKTAVDPVVITGDRLEWDLGYTNIDSTPIDGMDLIDVLPYRGDSRNSTFHGSARLAEAIAVNADAGERVRYTERDPREVELDPNAPSNTADGATTWCSEDELGADGCPKDLADVTAFRIQRTAPVAIGATITHRVAVATTGEHDGDAYTNRFGLRASNLALPVLSNPATITVVSGALGDRVWSDENADGLQDDGEPGIADVPVRLTGTDDRGADVERDTSTGPDGAYTFNGLRPGTYTVRWTAPDGRAFTEEHVGDDRALDSDADAAGSTGAIQVAALHSDEGQLDGVERDSTIDAGILPEPKTPIGPPVTPEEPGNPDEPGTPGTTEIPGAAAGTSGGNAPHSPSPAKSTAGKTAQGELAFTGAAGLGVAGIAAALLVLGGGFLLMRRRRATSTDEH